MKSSKLWDVSTDKQETDQRATLKPDNLKSSLNFKIIKFQVTLKAKSLAILTFSEQKLCFKNFFGNLKHALKKFLVDMYCSMLICFLLIRRVHPKACCLCNSRGYTQRCRLSWLTIDQ
jgi:hypothetical protein